VLWHLSDQFMSANVCARQIFWIWNVDAGYFVAPRPRCSSKAVALG
jgi:hypothetical protein